MNGSGHPPKAFWHEIATVLAVKTAALVALYFLFFASPPRVPDLPLHVFQAGQMK